MAQHIFDLLRTYLAQYGYWAVAVALLLENAGLPVPGESVLLLASFLAFSEHRLHFPYIIVVGICAATLGDNIGFAIGYYGGRRLLDHYRTTLHIRPAAIARGEELFARYGAIAVFFARFLAGVLRMHWRKFVVFNFLGAALWVTVISSAGYFFGRHWEEVVRVVRSVNITVLAAAALVLAFFWWKRRRHSSAN